MQARKLDTPGGDPTIHVRDLSTGEYWVEYTFENVGGDGGESYPEAIREDLRLALPYIYSNLYVIDNTDRMYPTMHVIIIIKCLDYEAFDEDLYDELWPITKVVNDIDVWSYVIYD